MIRSSIGHQRGRTLLGFIVGLVVGLGVAVAVALYITNAPVPFVNKVRPASENINPGAGGQLPDPNKPLQAPTRGPDVTTMLLAGIGLGAVVLLAVVWFVHAR